MVLLRRHQVASLVTKGFYISLSRSFWAACLESSICTVTLADCRQSIDLLKAFTKKTNIRGSKSTIVDIHIVKMIKNCVILRFFSYWPISSVCAHGLGVFAIYSTHLCVRMSRFMLHLCLAGRQVHFNTCSKLSLLHANTHCAVQANQYTVSHDIDYIFYILHC